MAGLAWFPPSALQVTIMQCSSSLPPAACPLAPQTQAGQGRKKTRTAHVSSSCILFLLGAKETEAQLTLSLLTEDYVNMGRDGVLHYVKSVNFFSLDFYQWRCELTIAGWFQCAI